MASNTYKNKTSGDAVDHSHMRILQNRKTALVWLRKQGWKVSQASFYRHAKQGKLEVSTGGTIGQAALELYALSYLQKAESPPDHRAVAGLLQTEKECQVALLRAREEKIRFETSLARGRYLLRDEVYTAFAIRLSILESTLKNTYRTNAVPWLLACGADPAAAETLVGLMEKELDALLDFLGDLEELRVKVVRNPLVPVP